MTTFYVIYFAGDIVALLLYILSLRLSIKAGLEEVPSLASELGSKEQQKKAIIMTILSHPFAYLLSWLSALVHIRHKKQGSKAIVEYDFATGFGGRDFTSLALTNIEDDGSLGTSWAWASYSNYELVDTEHTEENIARIREKNMRNKSLPPYYLKEEIARMFYGQPTRTLIE